MSARYVPLSNHGVYIYIDVCLHVVLSTWTWKKNVHEYYRLYQADIQYMNLSLSGHIKTEFISIVMWTDSAIPIMIVLTALTFLGAIANIVFRCYRKPKPIKGYNLQIQGQVPQTQ